MKEMIDILIIIHSIIIIIIKIENKFTFKNMKKKSIKKEKYISIKTIQ